MRKIYLLIAILTSPVHLLAENLPGMHELKQNEAGEYYVVNKKDITMIEASILKLGYNGEWILACIKHEAIDSDLKRWVFVDVKNGGTFDSLHQENWVYFSNEAYPELKEISLKNLSDEDCP